MFGRKIFEIEFTCSCCGEKAKKHEYCRESEIVEYAKKLNETSVCHSCFQRQDEAVKRFIKASEALNWEVGKGSGDIEELKKEFEDSYNECKRWKVVR